MSKNDAVSALTVLGILRDTLDDLCDAGERVVIKLEEYNRRLEPFKDIKISDQAAIQQIVTQLPPKNTAALVSALISVAELVPPAPPIDPKEQFRKIKDDLTRLQNIRDNLHAALDGVVR